MSNKEEQQQGVSIIKGGGRSVGCKVRKVMSACRRERGILDRARGGGGVKQTYSGFV